jgi:hypothetical protein
MTEPLQPCRGGGHQQFLRSRFIINRRGRLPSGSGSDSGACRLAETVSGWHSTATTHAWSLGWRVVVRPKQSTPRATRYATFHNRRCRRRRHRNADCDVVRNGTSGICGQIRQLWVRERMLPEESADKSSPYCVGEGGASRAELPRTTLVDEPVTEIDCACFRALRLLIDIALSSKSFRSN